MLLYGDTNGMMVIVNLTIHLENYAADKTDW